MTRESRYAWQKRVTPDYSGRAEAAERRHRKAKRTELPWTSHAEFAAQRDRWTLHFGHYPLNDAEFAEAVERKL